MKRMLIICIICCNAISYTNAQMRDTVNLKNQKFIINSFLLKSKKQKITGWMLLSAGAALTTASFIIYSNEKSKNPHAALDIFPKGWAFGAIGESMMVVSVPFFLSSWKNKKKANLMLEH